MDSSSTVYTEFEEDDVVVQRISNFIHTPTIPVTVGEEYPQTFHLHEALIARESCHFWKKTSLVNSRLTLDEDPRLFTYFVDFIYRENWTELRAWKGLQTLDCITVAHLYCLGKRLEAVRFQKAALFRIISLIDKEGISVQEIYKLLTIVYRELVGISNGKDPLRKFLVEYAASHIDKLRKFNEFWVLAEQNSQLPLELILHVGNGLKPRTLVGLETQILEHVEIEED